MCTRVVTNSTGQLHFERWRELCNFFFKSDGKEVYEYYDQSWIRIADEKVVAALQSMFSSGADATYSLGGNSYTARLIKKNTDAIQKNDHSGVERALRCVTSKATTSVSTVMFDKATVVPLDDDLISAMLSDSFAVPASTEMSLELAELAQLASSVGNKFVYAVPAGTASTSGSHFVSHTDGTADFNSELWVKPMALYNFLQFARARGYNACRLVFHGAKKEGYDGIRSDFMGFDMEFAGSHGQVYGNGLYFGMTDHATLFYNKGYTNGSCVIGLMLVKESEGWQHHHRSGSFALQDINKTPEKLGLYKTLDFSSPAPGTDNAVIVRDAQLVLPLGLVHACDPGVGWTVA